MAISFNGRRLLRFNIGTLLFVMLALSVGLGGYAAGRQAGERQLRAETFFTKIYSLADLIIAEPDDAARQAVVDDAIEHLITNVSPQTWSESKPANVNSFEVAGTIQPFRSNGSLVIHQRGAVHDKIEVALTKYRDDRTKPQLDRAVAVLDALAVEEDSEPAILFSIPADQKLADAARATIHDDLIRRLNAEWGKPRFSGDCFERGFPYWSLAQSITQWSKPSGDVYITIEDHANQEKVIIGGWRRRE